MKKMIPRKSSTILYGRNSERFHFLRLGKRYNQIVTKGIVFDIMHFSTHDGPGIRTTVFLKGCPLHCAWCHNPESQARGLELMLRPNLCIACEECIEACAEGAITIRDGVIVTDRAKCNLCGKCVEVCNAEARALVGREMTVAEVMAEVQKDAIFYDESRGGVTFSGGEALMQPEFLLELLQACKEKGFHTAVDTCGFANWKVIERVRPFVDLFLYDLKTLDDEAHRRYTGVSNRPILANLKRLVDLGQPLILRMPLIPGVNDNPEAIREVGQFAASLPHLARLDILPYHQAGVEKYNRLDKVYHLAETTPPSDGEVAEVANILKGFDLNIQVGG
jgi:pyruvate formate lyase activating enzyme